MGARNRGPLAGIKVLDLSRVLAGPWCTQLLGDLGAEIVKVEQPGNGDDTRRWGPPFLKDGSGDSAYYLAANRNKRSVAIDLASSQGAELVRRLADRSDIVVENFKVGGLRKYGLHYEALAPRNARLIYCSITGFGQTGPYSNRGGYDFLIQGMSGLMSVTGRKDGELGEGPVKVGIPISDLATGLYSAISILAALHERDRSGRGQHIDMALLDTQVALLTNQASNYLNGGAIPRRLGNEHPNTVPYQDFACSDGDILVALGNERQFRAFCTLVGLPQLADDPRFADNARRNSNRAELQRLLQDAIVNWKSDELIAAMEEGTLPGGRVNEIPDILVDPQIMSRDLVRPLTRADGTEVKVLGYPGKFSRTPASYRHAPPRAGENTHEVLVGELGLTREELDALIASGVVAESVEQASSGAQSN